MSERIIALDAFGSDNCPDVEVEAAVIAARGGHSIILVGDQPILERSLGRFDGVSRLPLRIHHASETIVMDDSPAKAVRGKPDASMPVCFDLVRRGEANAVISAGNSGAMLACGLFKFGRIKGVDRPAIVNNVPGPRSSCALLDMGANVECKPLNLVQFAVMGAAFATCTQGKARPRVGVLANGSEEGKGTDLTRAAHRLLREGPSAAFSYVGYVEGKDLFSAEVDVVITDGFTGNIALKVLEGTARAPRRLPQGRDPRLADEQAGRAADAPGLQGAQAARRPRLLWRRAAARGPRYRDHLSWRRHPAGDG